MSEMGEGRKSTHQRLRDRRQHDPYVSAALRAYDTGMCSYEQALEALALALSEALEGTKARFIEHLQRCPSPPVEVEV